MEEQYLNYDLDAVKTEIDREQTEYEKKIEAIKKAYADLEEYKRTELEKHRFIENKLLKWKSGVYYILYKEEVFYEIDKQCLDNQDEIYKEYQPYTVYIVYDGEFICKISNGLYNTFIDRTVKCKLPQVDKQLEYYNIKLKFEELNKEEC